MATGEQTGAATEAMRESEEAKMSAMAAQGAAMGGSLTEAIGGAVAVVLAISALAGVGAAYLVPITTIVVGAALLFVGAGIMSRYRRLLGEIGEGAWGTMDVEAGMTAEFLAGAAGIILGILALLEMVPATMAATAVIVFGGALILGTGLTTRINDLAMAGSGAQKMARRLAHEATLAASGAQVLVGLAAVILGVLALSGVSPDVLPTVALLTLGASILLSGAAVSGRIMCCVAWR